MLQVLVVLGLIATAWYLLIVRPQRQQQGRHEQVLGQLTLGTGVMTVGGIFGRVTAIEGETIVIEMAPGMVTRVAADGIARIVPGAAQLPVAAAAPTTAASQAEHTPQHVQDGTMHQDPHQQQPQHQLQPQQWQAPAPPMQPMHVQQATPMPSYAVVQQAPIAAPFGAGVQPIAQAQPMAAPTPQQVLHPMYAQQQPQMTVQHAAPQMMPAGPAQPVTLRATVAPDAPQPQGFEPRPFAAIQLPPPPVITAFTPRPAPVAMPQYAVQPESIAQPVTYAPAGPAPQMYAPAAPPQPQMVIAQPMMPQPMMPQPMVAAAPHVHQVVPQVDGPAADVHVPGPELARRAHSTAPEGMGSGLRLDDPSLQETIERARRERGELADEYRRHVSPFVVDEAAGADPAMQAAEPTMVVQPDAGGALFVHPHHAQQQVQSFPAPAHPPTLDMVMPRPGIAGIAPAGSSEAFQRPAPYSPQPAAAG